MVPLDSYLKALSYDHDFVAIYEQSSLKQINDQSSTSETTPSQAVPYKNQRRQLFPSLKLTFHMPI